MKRKGAERLLSCCWGCFCGGGVSAGEGAFAGRAGGCCMQLEKGVAAAGTARARFAARSSASARRRSVRAKFGAAPCPFPVCAPAILRRALCRRIPGPYAVTASRSRLRLPALLTPLSMPCLRPSSCCLRYGCAGRELVLGIFEAVVFPVPFDGFADDAVAWHVLRAPVHMRVPREEAAVGRQVVNVGELLLLRREGDLACQHVAHVVLRGLELQQVGELALGDDFLPFRSLVALQQVGGPCADATPPARSALPRSFLTRRSVSVS